MRRTYINLVIIVILAALAIFIALPSTTNIFGKSIQTQLGLDLQGGVQALLEADVPPGTSVDNESMNTAARIVENRVNGLGVTEALVQRAAEDRIVVELPGEQDPDKSLAVLKETGLLEFVDFSELTDAEIQTILASNLEIKTDFDASLGSTEDQNTTIAETSTISPTTSNETSPIFHTVMTGDLLQSALAESSPTGGFQVAFELKPEGADIFQQYTRDNIGTVLAIVLDNRVISTPVIQNEIPDGQGVITGSFTNEEANSLAIQLRYGSLPVPLKVISVRTVGPTLGLDSLNKSLVAGAIGFAIVILFMAIYYRLPGVIADIAIIFYALIAFAIFRFYPITLTLAGIAGFLLSTGSALDANILIFERFKEELRAGKPLELATRQAWQRAWPSIRDSNIATIITCAILFFFGNTFGASIVKGFALTLSIGVGISLLTAIFVTRAMFEVAIKFFKLENYPRWFGI